MGKTTERISSREKSGERQTGEREEGGEGTEKGSEEEEREPLDRKAGKMAGGSIVPRANVTKLWKKFQPMQGTVITRTISPYRQVSCGGRSAGRRGFGRDMNLELTVFRECLLGFFFFSFSSLVGASYALGEEVACCAQAQD